MSLAFVGLMLYTFLEYLRPDVLFPNVAGFPLLRIVAILTGILFLFEQFGEKKSFTKAPQNYFLLAFLFWLTFTHIFSGGKMLWYARRSFFEFGKIVFVYFILINIIDSKRRLDIYVNFIMLITLYLAIGAILQSIFSYDIPGFALETSRSYESISSEVSSGFRVGRIRYSGIFADANDFAQILLVGLAFLINCALAPATSKKKLFLFCGSFLTITAILLTASRGGFLGLLAVLFLYARRRYGSIKSGVLVSILITILLVSGLFFTERMTNLSFNEASAHGRIEIWTEGLYMLWSNPIFGVGHRFFEEHIPRTAHNSMILVGAETGLIGLYLWLGLIYLTYKHISLLHKQKNSTSNPALHKDEYILNGLSDALTGFLVTAFFLSRSYIFVMYFLIGLAIAFLRTCGYNSYSFGTKDIIMIVLLEVGCLIVWKAFLVAGWSL